MIKSVFILLLPVFCVINVVSLNDLNPNAFGYSLEAIEQEFREQDKDIHRPCPAYDLLCIRRYLAQHSKCKPTNGPVPDPFFRLQNDNFDSFLNLTVTQTEIYIRGLMGNVVEFYVNRKSGLTILAVEFPKVTREISRAYFRYHRRGQEPALTSTSLDKELLLSFITTTVFRGVDGLSLANSETTAFSNGIVLAVGPEAGIHSDPTIPARFAEFSANIPIALQEAFLTAAPFYASVFIQFVLCDFGLFVN